MANKNIKNLFLSAISYGNVLCFVPFLLHSKDDYVRFHAKQGLSIFIMEIIFTLIWIIPFIGWVIGALGWLACLVVSIIGFVKALFGERWEVPGLEKLVDKIKF